MTATALEDVHLLKIEQEEFYDLLSDHVEITQSIFKALVQRIKGLIGNQEHEPPSEQPSSRAN